MCILLRGAAIDSQTPRFIPRDPRYRIKTPLVLHLPDGDWKGHSIDISESGVWAVFDQLLDVWIKGKLSAIFGEWQIDLDVRVVRTDGFEAGLVFQGLSDKDRAIIKAFIGKSKGDLSPV
jgi:hypothetical protein